MTVKECYEQMGGNYDEIMARMMKEERVKKFAGMFLRDESYEQLKKQMEAHNTEEAFHAAHTLKGVTANLALTSLNKAAIDVTEALRGGDYDLGKSLMPALDEEYDKTIEALKELVAE